jgi:hypothetical protein
MFVPPQISLLGLFPSLYEGGKRLIESEELEAAFALQWTATAGIQAATAGSAAATPLNPGFNEINSVPTIGFSVRLPPASTPGQMVFVTNSAANDASVWANTPIDLVIAVSPSGTVSLVPGVTLPSGRREIFVCIRPGYWVMFLSA